MFTRLRTHVATLAALVAVACAPSPVLAGDPDGRQELCRDTTAFALTFVDLTFSEDKVAQQEFVDAWVTLDPIVKDYLLPYMQLAMLIAYAGYAGEDIEHEVFSVCMERKA